MPDQDIPKLSPVKGGRFFTKEQITEFRGNFERVKKRENESLRKGEFFSKELLETLLNVAGCDGVRIYYGLAPEAQDAKIDSVKGDKELPQPRLFIVPVAVERDADGNATEKSKDMTFIVRTNAGKDGGDEFGGGGEGLPCPGFCNP